MSAPAGREAPLPGWWRRNAVSLVLLVPVLAGLGWILSADMRSGWWVAEPHVAVTPGADGWASIDGTDARLVELSSLDEVVPDFGEAWEPPPGYEVLRLVVAVRSTLTEPRVCDVRLVDTSGRAFSTPGTVPQIPGWFGWSTLPCGFVDPDQEPPGPMLFVVPAGTEVATVRVFSARAGALSLGPEHFALPAP